jgi:hypothetical protein
MASNDIRRVTVTNKDGMTTFTAERQDGKVQAYKPAEGVAYSGPITIGRSDVGLPEPSFTVTWEQAIKLKLLVPGKMDPLAEMELRHRREREELLETLPADERPQERV